MDLVAKLLGVRVAAAKVVPCRIERRHRKQCQDIRVSISEYDFVEEPRHCNVSAKLEGRKVMLDESNCCGKSDSIQDFLLYLVKLEQVCWRCVVNCTN